MAKYHPLFYLIRARFAVVWPEDVCPWDLTVDAVCAEIEMLLEQQRAEDPDETGLRKQVFEEIRQGLAGVLQHGGQPLRPEQRFNDLVPWYRRAKALNSLYQSLDDSYAWLFDNAPFWRIAIPAFLTAGLVGAIWMDSFEEPWRGFAILTSLVTYVVSVLLLHRFFRFFSARFPFDTIGQAVDTVVDLIMRGPRCREKFRDNPTRIREELLDILLHDNAGKGNLHTSTVLMKDAYAHGNQVPQTDD